MVTGRMTIQNEGGLQLRPAARFCEEAMGFESVITFTNNDNTANAKSILSILGACVRCGDEIEVVCVGPDEQEALAAITAAVGSGLKDPEEAGGTRE